MANQGIGDLEKRVEQLERELELLKRIAELEKELKQLKSKEVVYVYSPYYVYPYYNLYPWYPYITCGTVETGASSDSSGIASYDYDDLAHSSTSASVDSATYTGATT
jgi:hypothetical protein